MHHYERQLATNVSSIWLLILRTNLLNRKWAISQIERRTLTVDSYKVAKHVLINNSLISKRITTIAHTGYVMFICVMFVLINRALRDDLEVSGIYELYPYPKVAITFFRFIGPMLSSDKSVRQ